MIVALPDAAFAVTRPFASTVALVSSEDVQVTALLAGTVVAVSCAVAPFATVLVAGSTVTDGTVAAPLLVMTEIASAFSSRMKASYLILPSQFVIAKAFYPLLLEVSLILTVGHFRPSSAYIFTLGFTRSGVGYSWGCYILFPVSIPMRYGVASC